MKQRLLNLTSVMLLGILLLTGCKKEVEPLTTADQTGTENDLLGIKSCRLTKIWYSPDAYVKFHYNSHGLADKWITHFDDNTEEVYDIEYDASRRMKKATYSYEGEFLNTIRFVYSGRNITKEIWYDPAGDVYMTIYDSYNFLGQITKRENTLGVKVLFSNNLIGNTPRIKTYVDNELSVAYEYTYLQPNQNPFKAIPGIPFGFPYMELTFSAWWETSEKATEYIDGEPTVLYADDPNQTVMTFGNHHTLASLFDYDYFNEESRTTSFEYENCGSIYNVQNSPSIPIQSAVKQHSRSIKLELSRAMHNGKNSKEIKENLIKLKTMLLR